MLPPALDFDLRPRRSRAWLRVLMVSLVLSAIVGSALGLGPWHAELERLRAELARAQVASTPAAVMSERPAQWQASASQDGALFALSVEARLLEIERCTEAKTVVTRVVHDAAEQSTSLELNFSDSGAVRDLLECLNQSAEKQAVWRLLSVELQAAAVAPAAGTPPSQRVVLRYP